MNISSTADLEKQAVRIRRKIIELSMIGNGNSHYGGSLSIVEILLALYGNYLKFDIEHPNWQDRDRFFLSKGHGVLAYYTILAEAGFIDEEKLLTYQKDYSDLISHPVMNLQIGIEASNGSLGHGLSLAIGSLLAARVRNRFYKAVVLLGNGECDEGSVWEAAMAAVQYKLDRLLVIIDNNGMQSDGASLEIMDTSNLSKKWQAFGWNTIDVDGHNFDDLLSAFSAISQNQKPSAIIANTVKGKGISFMENNNDWHHNRLTTEQYEQALIELTHDRHQ